jgi:hypothetical protein
VTKRRVGLHHRLAFTSRCPKVLHQQNEVQGISGALFKLAEMQIEVLRGLGLGVDEKGTHADHVRRLHRPLEGIDHQGSPEPGTLSRIVYSESGEEDDRYRMASGPPERPTGGVTRLYRTGREGVVANYRSGASPNRHIDSGCPRSLGLACMA